MSRSPSSNRSRIVAGRDPPERDFGPESADFASEAAEPEPEEPEPEPEPDESQPEPEPDEPLADEPPPVDGESAVAVVPCRTGGLPGPPPARHRSERPPAARRAAAFWAASRLRPSAPLLDPLRPSERPPHAARPPAGPQPSAPRLAGPLPSGPPPVGPPHGLRRAWRQPAALRPAELRPAPRRRPGRRPAAPRCPARPMRSAPARRCRPCPSEGPSSIRPSAAAERRPGGSAEGPRPERRLRRGPWPAPARERPGCPAATAVPGGQGHRDHRGEPEPGHAHHGVQRFASRNPDRPDTGNLDERNRGDPLARHRGRTSIEDRAVTGSRYDTRPGLPRVGTARTPENVGLRSRSDPYSNGIKTRRTVHSGRSHTPRRTRIRGAPSPSGRSPPPAPLASGTPTPAP